MEITPAPFTTISRVGGRMVAVDDDVHGVARALREVHPDLRLRWSDRRQEFLVVQLVDGTEHPVTRARECDQRLVDAARRVTRPDYDFFDDLEALEAERRRERERAFEERMGEAHERLAHAVREDLRRPQAGRGGVYVSPDVPVTPQRIYVPRSVNGPDVR